MILFPYKILICCSADLLIYSALGYIMWLKTIIKCFLMILWQSFRYSPDSRQRRSLQTLLRVLHRHSNIPPATRSDKIQYYYVSEHFLVLDLSKNGSNRHRHAYNHLYLTETIRKASCASNGLGQLTQDVCSLMSTNNLYFDVTLYIIVWISTINSEIVIVDDNLINFMLAIPESRSRGTKQVQQSARRFTSDQFNNSLK